jgi:DNA-binding FadR family transcriptional regulator
MAASARVPRVYESIVEDLERAIYEGRLRQGDKLPPERQLVREFRASRVAVREALRTLEHRGLVVVRQGSTGGHFVREADATPLLRDLQTLLRLGRVSVAQLLEARALIEPPLAELAARRATDADVKTLTRILEQRAGAPPDRARALDAEFHRLLAEAAGNPVHSVVTHVLMHLEREVVAPRFEPAGPESAEIATDHVRILEAVAARDGAEARARMEAHLAAVLRQLDRGAAARIAG